MIGYENTMGTVEISQEYFANLIGMAASECYGVAGMINSTYRDCATPSPAVMCPIRACG